MINFGISASKQQQLQKQFDAFNIKESDIIEKFIHSHNYNSSLIVDWQLYHIFQKNQ